MEKLNETYRIFIVEDDEGIAFAVKQLAECWGYKVAVCDDFQHVTEQFVNFSPHIVILDIGLPFAGGYYWCGEIRKISSLPIIIISSMNDNMNAVTAMNTGADDFIAKPFDGGVLMAKIRALLRRSYVLSASMPVLEHKGVFLQTGDNTLVFGDSRVELTKNEYRILLCLFENKGNVVSRERLMERLWETDCFVDENTLTVNVNRLRKKLSEAGLDGFITTKFGVGYILE